MEKNPNGTLYDLKAYLNQESEQFISQKQWSCLKCTYLNDWDLVTCAICFNSKNFNSNVIYH